MVLLDPGLWTTRFVQCRPTIKGNAVYTRCFQAMVIVDVAEETGSVVRWGASSSDLFRQCPANAVEGGQG
jgi:hypothetical protein